MKIVDYDYECMNVFITADKGGISHLNNFEYYCWIS